MTEEREVDSGVNPFVANLSALNVVFALSLSVFSYAVIIYLQGAGIPIYLAGAGLTAGQALTLGTSILQGRAIDKGHSFGLMVLGSILYGGFMVLLYLNVTLGILPFYFVGAYVAAIMVSEGIFKSALNSFIAKAVAMQIMGAHYARILTAETIGSAIAYIVMIFGILEFSLSIVFLGSGLFLLFLSIIAFLVLKSKGRDAMRKSISELRRPGFRESLTVLKKKSRYIGPIISSKALMTVGLIGFTFFYVPTGIYLGVKPQYSLFFLFITYVAAALMGTLGEKFVDRRIGLGRMFVTLTMLLDVVSYGIIFLSVILGNIDLFLIAVLFSSPGVLFISGAMTYEVSIIGRENRGMFGAVQRQTIGFLSAFASLPLTLVFTYNVSYMWGVIWVASILSVLVSLAIPSGTGEPVPVAEGGS